MKTRSILTIAAAAIAMTTGIALAGNTGNQASQQCAHKNIFAVSVTSGSHQAQITTRDHHPVYLGNEAHHACTSQCR